MNGPDMSVDLFYIGHTYPSLLLDPPQIPDERILDPLAHHLWTNGRISEAMTCLHLLELRAPLSKPNLVLKGYRQLNEGTASAALGSFTAALQSEPDNASIRQGYAYALFALEDYAAATPVFRRLADESPHVRSLAVMASASLELAAGRKPELIYMAPLPGLPAGMAEAMQMRICEGPAPAIAYAKSAIASRPANGALPLERLVLEWYLELDLDQDAARLSSALHDMYPDDGPLLFLHGLVLRRLGEKDASHQAFSAATFHAPLESRAWGGFAAGLLERNELDRAASMFRVALFLDDAKPSFWGDLGMIEATQKRYDAAHRAFSKAIELGAQTFTNYFNRAQCSLMLGNELECVQDWASALRVDPAHRRAAEVIALMGKRYVDPADQRFYF